MTDVIIIGAGPAGLTAGVYAVRAGLSAVVFESSFCGGQIAVTAQVENFPSIQKISGYDLAANIQTQAQANGVDIRFEPVLDLRRDGEINVVTTAGGDHRARIVIIANGVRRRTLNVPGESALTGRGVSYCAVCDGAFFRGKTAVVVGGANTALEDALYLSAICEKVILVCRRDRFKGQQHLLESAQKCGNITFMMSASVVRIKGDTAVSAVDIQTPDGVVTVDTDAVFIAIGLEPDNSRFSGAVQLDADGYIIAGADCRTGCPSIFAAGDTRTKQVRQIITAAADGAVAATLAAQQLSAGK